MRRSRIALLVLACALVAEACSSEAAPVTVLVVGPDAAAVDSGVDDAVAPVPDAAQDAGPDVTGDAADAAESCVEPPIEDALSSSSCAILGACPTCSTGSWYRCNGARQRPAYAATSVTFTPLLNSRPIATMPGTEDYCAPSACVRAQAEDASCFMVRPFAVRCAPGVTAPLKCSFSSSDATSTLVCCGST